MTTALILSGGGARAAYQVGVLRGVAEIIGRERQPYDIICGTSAGAINAAYMAAYAHCPGEGIDRLYKGWRALSARDVYDTTWFGVLHSLSSIALGVIRGTSTNMPSAVLDNAPLRRLLAEWLDFAAIRNNIANKFLRDLCITAMNYSTGESVAFHEGVDPIVWRRVHRIGQPATLSIDHIIASSAIPILFPPQTIDGHYFGDGALRQLNPLSPALHLGATRLLIVGVSANLRDSDVLIPEEQPSIAQMAGHLLNREFIDNLEADIEHAEKINELIAELLRSDVVEKNARIVDILVITPSISFDDVATRYIHRQPASIRFLFRIIGARGKGAGASFASYLMFDGGFCNDLIDAGYRDALNSAKDIRAFFPGDH
ncbi:MAG: patatin-like phospholipase family protein [Gammaproteobacteria bacterium]|nr:patatin-like phospholipase family protein [Gammaproteobacteria bacterium]